MFFLNKFDKTKTKMTVLISSLENKTYINNLNTLQSHCFYQQQISVCLPLA